jgi:hypothetical protein
MLAILLAGSVVLGFVGLVSSSCSPSGSREAAQLPAGSTSQAATAAHTGNQAVQDVQALADELGKSSDTAYTGVYTTASGLSVTVAQSTPLRSYKSGRDAFILTPTVAYLCKSGQCQHLDGDDDLSPDLARQLSAVFGQAFIAPEAALEQLGAAVSGSDAKAATGKRTIAGAGVDCVAASGNKLTTQTACVSPSGILVYFSGTSDQGATVRMQLTSYQPTAAQDAFTPPS